jgi:protein PhnA
LIVVFIVVTIGEFIPDDNSRIKNLSLINFLKERSGNQCELCSSTHGLDVYNMSEENSLFICETCLSSVDDPKSHSNHWRCLNESMWSEHAPVQAMAYRLLYQLSELDWAKDLFNQLFIDDTIKEMAMEGLSKTEEGGTGKSTKDSNGNILVDGDSVTLIKDLDVKGAGFTAKRGTLVKNISLTNNPEHIEGKVNGTQIVLVTRFLKKV